MFTDRKIVLFIEFISDIECHVFTRNEDKYLIIKKIPIERLSHYARHENIRQDIRPGEPALNLDYIIENYFI